MKKYLCLLPGLICLAVALSLFASCRKVYVDKFHMLPADTISGITDIVSFQLHEFSPDTTIKATIKGDSIIVYWPAYKPLPATISPDITLPASCTVTPVSGTTIAFENGKQYTVTSEAGISDTYTLYIDFRQQQPSIANINPYLSNGRLNDIRGANFLEDTSRTKVYLIAADNTEYLCETAVAGPEVIKYIIPKNVPADQLYDIKLINGVYTLYDEFSPNRGQFFLQNSTAAYLYAYSLQKAVKAGGTFELRGNAVSTALRAVILTGENLTEIPVEIEAVNGSDRLLIRIPANVPPGVYNQFALYYSTDGLNGPYAYTSGFSLKIIP